MKPTIQALIRRQHDRCTACEHPISAMSLEAVAQAVQEHVEYVNTQLDRATDVHFELHRLDILAS